MSFYFFSVEISKGILILIATKRKKFLNDKMNTDCRHKAGNI